MKVNYTINEFDIALEESIDGSIASCDIDAYVQVLNEFFIQEFFMNEMIELLIEFKNACLENRAF